MRIIHAVPFRTAIYYFVASAAWILLSDRVVETFISDVRTSTLFQTWKGGVFVLASSILIGASSLRQHRLRDRAEYEKRAADRQALQDYRVLVERIAVLEQRVGSAYDLAGVCRALNGFVQDTAPSSTLLMARLDSVAKQRIYTFVHADGVEKDVRTILPSPLGTDIGSRAILTRNVVVVDGSAIEGPATSDVAQGLGLAPARAAIAVPLVIDGGVVGVFEVQNREVEAFEEEQVVALKMAANLMAIALQNMELWRREHETRRSVEASEARFRSLVQNSSDVIRMLDHEGATLYESPSIQRILGYAPESRSAERAFERIHPDDVLRVKRELADAMKTGRGESTYRVRHANGEWRWFESIGVNLFDDPHVGAFVLNSRDITERKRAEEDLREEKGFNEAIINSFPGIFYVLGEDGQHHQWNRNYTRLLGYDDGDLARLRPIDLYEGDDREHIARAIEEVFTKGSASVEASIIAKDGRRIPLFLAGERVTLGGETCIAGIGLDLSEIRSARDEIENLNGELQERLDRIGALREIDQAITGSAGLQDTLDVALTQVRRSLNVDAANLLLYRPVSQTLRFGTAQGIHGSRLRSEALPLGQGLTGAAALKRQNLFLDAPDEIEKAFGHVPKINGQNVESYLAVPLLAKGELQGVLELFHRTPIELSEDWRSFLDALAAQVAIALENASMLESLERSNQELRLAYDTTIEGWARALDLKDEETEGHSRRVTELTVQLAEFVGMSEQDIVHVRRGALLHDIGKMGVPDAILLKPGKLDAEEWEEMKRHTKYALEFLSPIPFLRSALDIPYCHHERWDGSGYPRGLKGQQIPLAARIFSVVDVYDALTSDRPYRKAWSEERALAFIRQQAGIQFDPDIVKIFLTSAHRPVKAKAPSASLQEASSQGHLGPWREITAAVAREKN